jgi:hypothetical protein
MARHPAKPIPALSADDLERFWSKVDVRGPDECWPWKGAPDRHGYGRIRIGGRSGRTVLAHRVSYVLKNGEPEPELVLDHDCRNRPCCNPDHTVPRTNQENTVLGVGPSAAAARQTHCAKGHELIGNNLFVRTDNGGRGCRRCHVERSRAYRRRKAVALA